MLDQIPSNVGPADLLRAIVRSQLDHAVDSVAKGHRVYESLRNLNEVIGAQYGDRVLYELVQNAHDAHSKDERGKIAVKLVIESKERGFLYVANGGAGFTFENVDAIRNLALSSKEIGEGIGNKGLGFRSVEALTDDVHIYSKSNARSKSFDGFCFRFPNPAEVNSLLKDIQATAGAREKVARIIPKYLLSLPIECDQPADVRSFALSGYATVVVLHLRTAKAIELAAAQVKLLSELEVPLLLFLDRVSEVLIEIWQPQEKPKRIRLQRRDEKIELGNESLPGCSFHIVHVGQQHRFLLIRKIANKERILEAVRSSIPRAPQLQRWLNWKGDAVVSIAVNLGRSPVSHGRLYNFLPMGAEAVAPFPGYLDAPFFTDIDRRQAKLDLPLNDHLMDVAAGACASAALYLTNNQHIRIPATAVFDLVAWSLQPWRMDRAFKALGTSLKDANIVPTIGLAKYVSWTSISKAKVWPSGRYTIFAAREVARRLEPIVVSPRLGEERSERLNQLGRALNCYLKPSGDLLGSIAEAFAKDLASQEVPIQTWSVFYEEVFRLCTTISTGIKCLERREVLLDRTGKLKPAVPETSENQSPIFLRDAKASRSRSKVPIPPAFLSRRYAFFDDRIRLNAEFQSALVKANYLRPYDPIEALSKLSTVLTAKSPENWRFEALNWAFAVWKAVGEEAASALQQANLSIPTFSGWTPANEAIFSGSWSRAATRLENFLVEASAVSLDCKQASQKLTVTWKEWPRRSEDTKADWTRFLEELGVTNGLTPIGPPLYMTGSRWNALVQHGSHNEGFDQDWCIEAAKGGVFAFPQTYYSTRGAGWRLPGQLEHEELSDSLKQLFAMLVLEHLKEHGRDYLEFDVGRFERSERDQDRHTLPTPFASFLRSKAWLTVSSKDRVSFGTASSCWAVHSGSRSSVPRFMKRLSEQQADILDDDELAEIAFGEAIGIRDWLSPLTSADRLYDLAAVAGDIESADRSLFRREYRRAWFEVCKFKLGLRVPTTLAVYRRSQLEVLRGNFKRPNSVVVAGDLSTFEIRALSQAGRPILDVGEAPLDSAIELIKETHQFSPITASDAAVELVVDGRAFSPSSKDPLLVDGELSWLPELAVIAHATRAQQLEKVIAPSAIPAKLGIIRLRRCNAISVIVDGVEATSDNPISFYSFEHGELPTLIVAGMDQLSWHFLARAADSISQLVDHRLRSLKWVIVELLLQQPNRRLELPSSDELASILSCDREVVQEQILEFRSDVGRTVKMLAPVVCYLQGLQVARLLEAEANLRGWQFDPEMWLVQNVSSLEPSAAKIIEACRRAPEFSHLRHSLGLEFAKFNVSLSALGETTISNEQELRTAYSAYLQELRPRVIDRLRRYYYGAFKRREPLSDYVTEKTLTFLRFDEGWISQVERLDHDLVAAHVSRLIEDRFGQDSDLALAEFLPMVEGNRKVVSRTVNELRPIVGAWCKRNSVQVPSLWSESTGAVARRIEDCGLIDFEPVKREQVPELCGMIECWPAEMDATFDLAKLKLKPVELEEESRRREDQRSAALLAERTITFGNVSLDSGNAEFSLRFEELASKSIEEDSSWLERSKAKSSLATFSSSETYATATALSGSMGRRSRERSMTEAQRLAVGMAGEWLAYRYLRDKHAEFVNDTCWISENRRHFFGGSRGDDSAGYDFRVITPSTQWFYEVKSTVEDGNEFELTANELRVASSLANDRGKKYRILYVRRVLSPSEWFVRELPNPMNERTRNHFRTIGQGSLRMRFEEK